MYAIQQAYVINSGKYANIFCDSGSNVSYITHSAANRLNAKSLDNCTLDMTTMGNVQTSCNTIQYEVLLRTETGKVVPVKTYGMNQITGPVSKLNLEVIRNLFPDYDANQLQRKSTKIDMLLGMDNFGLFPKTEVDRAGENLSIMKGELGVCLQGSHPELEESAQIDVDFVKTLHDITFKCATHHSTCILIDSHTEFNYPSFVNVGPDTTSPDVMLSKVDDVSLSSFILGEELAAEIIPGSKSSKCTTIGHTHSFTTAQEPKMTREGLVYNVENQSCNDIYPWLSNSADLQAQIFKIFNPVTDKNDFWIGRNILGRSMAKIPGGWQVPDQNFVKNLFENFWKRGVDQGTPELIIHKKWHSATQILKSGDVVVIADKNTQRGDYRIGLVQEVYPL